jgi:acyl dehydratase
VRDRYFEDFSVGERFRSRGVTFTESSIIDFALKYDPQYFHINTEAAEQSPYGGLIASGFQTLAQTFRMWLDEGVLAKCSIGAPGIDELRWLAPVRPGDTLHMEAEVVEVRPSSSRPERGTVRFAYASVNQRGETVMTLEVAQLVIRRPAAEG